MEMTADVQPTESDATPYLDTIAGSNSAATATLIPTVPTPTTSTATATTPIIVKRGRGRPRKPDTGNGTPNTFGTPDEITGDPSILPRRPEATTGSSSSSLPGSNQSQQRPTVNLNSTNPTNRQCESCMTFGARLYKFGKLKVCKECEDLMRTMTGSSRRQTVAPPNPPAASSSSPSISTVLRKQGHSVSTAPSHQHRVIPKGNNYVCVTVTECLDIFDISLASHLIDLPIGECYLVASTPSKQDYVGLNTISRFSTVPHSTFDPPITTISPSSLVLVPEPKHVSVILTKRGEIAKKRGRKPKPRDESTNLIPKVAPMPGMHFIHR